MSPSTPVFQKFAAVLDGCVVLPVTLDDKDSEGMAAKDRVVKLLNDFAVDVVVVAPACSEAVSLPLENLSAAWGEKKVLVQAKPVQARAAVQQQTWLADQKSEWQFDGVLN